MSRFGLDLTYFIIDIVSDKLTDKSKKQTRRISELIKCY